ncbi:hypothetical protein AA0115_g5269 [Alternaria tenuissima]|uniref:AAA+ ATPase domain-containing protein n=1 Tax=Alternaria tenuissima TaxID=119927 RepID=A0AB37WJU6_9PLEO|nr:hypothetical protein AA0115_g5269 [Alternaria tenuissima]
MKTSCVGLPTEPPIDRQVTIHRVYCSRTHEDHTGHLSSAYFLDIPALPAGAKPTTPLHGQNRLMDIGGYLAGWDGFGFVIYLDYDCEAYHESTERAGGPRAQPTSERLQLSRSLEEALTALHEQDTKGVEEWNFREDPVYPYTKLYDCKRLFVKPVTKVLEPQQQLYLEILFRYLTDRLSSDHEELEKLSTTGLTNLRYMVDMEAYRLMHGRDDELPRQSELTEDVLRNDEIPEGPFALLLPATIIGYGFHNKKWSVLLVEHIQDIKWNSGVFDDRLVLEESKKELVKALVMVHNKKSREIQTDFMDGKGNGLIMLLHGEPGTGKTLTAESIAEFVQRPLYRVTCGDIGSDPESVQKYLEASLYIGSTWDCVVLLDEADVFLEERTKTDLQRNALVSVFLRVLEYYDGILILTTNRIGTFDEAFKSRIQLALRYPRLNKEGRWEIWRNFVHALSEAGENINGEEIIGKLDILARHRLDGRQIRNTISTARQLAQYKKEKLRYSHVDQAVRVANEFEKYAGDQGLRNDGNSGEVD